MTPDPELIPEEANADLEDLRHIRTLYTCAADYLTFGAYASQVTRKASLELAQETLHGLHQYEAGKPYSVAFNADRRERIKALLEYRNRIDGNRSKPVEASGTGGKTYNLPGPNGMKGPA
jgi:hypothetical protein